MAAIVDIFGRRGLVVGIANDSSIAAGCATAFKAAGADLAVTYLNDKAVPFVRPVADALGASLFMPCDVRIDGQLEAVFDTIANEWAASISCFIRSPSRHDRTCRRASSTAPLTVSRRPWIYRAIPLSEWRGSPPR